MMGKRLLKSVFTIFSFLFLLSFVVNGGGFSNAIASNSIKNDIRDKLTRISDNLIENFSDDYNSPTNSSSAKTEKNTEYVYIGGFPIGIKLYCDGVIVVDTQNVETSGVYENPAQKAGIMKGDVIKSIDGKKVTTNSEVSELIEESNGNPLEIQISRNGELKNVIFSSVYSSVAGQYKAGLWIRDSSAGIGTVTFFTDEGEFASLGHAVCDIDTGKVLPLSGGETTDALITGCNKGKSGTAGELCGVLESGVTGEIMLNEKIGVYGVFNKVDTEREKYPLASKSEVKPGAAQIVTTVENGEPKKYNIEIERIEYISGENKNMVIKVVDSELINKTGGIIQGMSGSPIIQDGKLVGAVTHVFLNDPTGGYGIFAETMLLKADDLYQQKMAS